MSSLGGKPGKHLRLPGVYRVSLLVMAVLLWWLERMVAAAIIGYCRCGPGMSSP